MASPTAPRRFYVTPPGDATTERVRLRRLNEPEYRIMSRLAHGLLKARDVIEGRAQRRLGCPYEFGGETGSHSGEKY